METSTGNQPSTLPYTTQKAAVLTNPGPDFSFEIREIPVTPPGPDEVLVEIDVTGICGTDVGLASGFFGPCNDVLGHEGVGRVIALGPGVSPDAVPLGQVVAVAWIRDACGSCHVCLRGEGETRCSNRIFSGVARSGTLARTAVVPIRYISPLPSDLAAEQIAPVVCAGLTAYNAVKNCEAVPGQWVLISGAGGVGYFAVMYARAMGYRVIAVDIGEARGKTCLDAGAEIYIDNATTKDLKEAVRTHTGEKLCAAAIVCVGVPAAYEAALQCVGHFGTLVCVGIPPRGSEVKFHPLTLIDLGVKVKGSLVGGRGDLLEALQFVQRGLVKPKIISIGLDELNEYVRKVSQLDGKLVVMMNK